LLKLNSKPSIQNTSLADTQSFLSNIEVPSIDMGVSSEPTALLSPLPRADGSAEFSQNGYTVLGAVNGPIEVQRRDELPEEAAIDVIVRPAAGVGGAELYLLPRLGTDYV
jgi:hypothetical protein